MNHLKITTVELAKICNVSQGTIDRALNNRGGISKTTKQKIIETAMLHGYRLPQVGKKDNLHIIGIVVFNLKNEYFTKLITDLENKLKELGYLLTIMITDYNKQTEIEAIRHLYNMGVDGIILCSVNSGLEFEKFLNGLNIPIVAVGNKVSSIPYVGIDDCRAMKELTKVVIEKGYKSIKYFSPALIYDNAYAQKKRFEGFMEAIKSFKNYSVIMSIDDIFDFYDDKTAIICSTDYYAMQVYIKTKGCSIFGFDGIDLIKKLSMPIKSVSYSTEDISKNAVDTILNRKKEDCIIEHVIEC